VKARVRGRASAPGTLTIRLQGRGLNLGNPSSVLPLAVLLVVDDPTATTGQCGATTFAQCTSLHGGAVVRCR
jgi:hypothetical protein